MTYALRNEVHVHPLLLGKLEALRKLLDACSVGQLSERYWHLRERLSEFDLEGASDCMMFRSWWLAYIDRADPTGLWEEYILELCNTPGLGPNDTSLELELEGIFRQCIEVGTGMVRVDFRNPERPAYGYQPSIPYEYGDGEAYGNCGGNGSLGPEAIPEWGQMPISIRLPEWDGNGWGIPGDVDGSGNGASEGVEFGYSQYEALRAPGVAWGDGGYVLDIDD